MIVWALNDPVRTKIKIAATGIIFLIMISNKAASYKISVVLCVFSVDLCVTKTRRRTFTEGHRGDTEVHRGNPD